MKTIAELASECGVHRTTLNKAVERGAIPARRSGSILLIDEESEQFKQWLQSRKRKDINNMSSNYYSPNRARLARQIMKLRGEGYGRQNIILELESQGHPNEHVLVDSIFDAPMPTTRGSLSKMKNGEDE